MRTMTETVHNIVKDSKYKTTFFGQDFLVLVLNSILGGFFIALSGFTFQRFLAFTNYDLFISALILPLGFLLCDAFWSDIFSNNFLYSIAAFEKKMRWKSFIYSTLLITFFNILGIVFFIACLTLAGSMMEVESIALHEISTKIAIGYIPTFFRAAFGSVCICTGSFLSLRTDSIWEKAVVIFLSVFVMCICGFEHATVDLYLFLSCPVFSTLYYIPNLILVYLGNVVGGLIFAGLFALEIDIEE